jgi:osmotically inducible protein OsmC
MAARQATAEWQGTLMEGSGRVRSAAGTFDGAYDFRSRFEDGAGTNPEELIGAAHAGCFSMALSGILTKAGHPPQSIQTTAKVHLEKQGEGFAITRIDLDTDAVVPGLDDAAFQGHADAAKNGCPVSKALAGVQIGLTARLANS